LGEDIKEKLIPRAIDWFTGEALQFEELDDDMEEGDFEDEVSFTFIFIILAAQSF
jgi:hypothetical protein